MERVRFWLGEVIFPLVFWALVIVGVVAFFRWRDQEAGKRVNGLDQALAAGQQAAAANRFAPPFAAAMKDEYGFADEIKAFLSPTAASSDEVPGRLLSDAGADTQVTLPTPLMAVDVVRRRPDKIEGKLPGDSRADTLADARTLVLIRCDKHFLGKYGGAVQGFSTICNWAALDMKASAGPTILAIGKVESSPPSKVDVLHQWGAVVGKRPDQFMADWVKARLAPR